MLWVTFRFIEGFGGARWDIVGVMFLVGLLRVCFGLVWSCLEAQRYHSVSGRNVSSFNSSFFVYFSLLQDF